MAKNPLTDTQLDALLAKGYISNEFYDSIKAQEDKDKALKSEAKAAEKDFRLAENEYTKKQELATDASSGMMSTAEGPKPGVTPPAEKPKSEPAGFSAKPPTASMPLGSQMPTSNPELDKLYLPPPPAKPGQYANINDILPAPKAVLPTSQVAGGQPQAPTPTPQPTAPLNIPKPTVAGVGNPFAGPTDFEKYLTPSERERKTQLVEENKLRGDIANRFTDVQMKEDTEIAQLERKRADEYLSLVNQQAKAKAKEDELVQQHLDMLNTESKELGQKKVDPNRAFSQLPTANKILAGIGLFFGAGGTKKGGENPALAQINRAIDRDIQAQEFDIKNQGASIDQRRGLLQDRIKQFGNNELARIAAKKDYLDIVDMNAKAILANNMSDKTRIKADDFLAGLQEQKDKTMYEFNQANDQRSRQLAAQAMAAQSAIQAKLYENYKAQRDAVLKLYSEGKVKNPDGTVPPVEQVLANPSRFNMASGSPETEEQLKNRTVFFNGKETQALSKEAADMYRNHQEAAPAVEKLYNQLKDAAKKGEGDKYDSARAQLIEILPKYYGFNRGPSVAQVKETFGEAIPGYWTYQLTSKDRTQNKLDIVKSTLDTQRESILEQTFGSKAPPSESTLGFKPNK